MRSARGPNSKDRILAFDCALIGLVTFARIYAMLGKQGFVLRLLMVVTSGLVFVVMGGFHF